MRRRIPALLLAAALLLTIPAYAAQDSQENFVRGRAYSGQFSDLTTASPFYDNVAALYEYGLSGGRADGTYGLQDPMTVGEVVIFAGRIRSIFRTGDAERGPAAHGGDGGPVSAGYLRYLQAEGVLGTELDAQLAAPATRAQVAHVLAGVLPEMPLINDQIVTEGYASRKFITDVSEYTPYYQDILYLYRTGLSVGSDETGSFLPEAPVTRGAAAAMLTRMVDPSLRLKPDWTLVERTGGSTLADLVPPGEYIPDPGTLEEMDETVRHMLSGGSSVLALQYPGITASEARRVMEQALGIVKTYCEQSYNSVYCTYNQAGRVTLTFSAANLGERTKEYREETMAAALDIQRQLWESGQLTSSMTDTEKARVYFTWICENCTYDYNAGDKSLSHIPYGLFANGTAVCDGYTGAYNLFLKLEGISCTALSGNGHIWTVAMLDGQEVHIDTTWGDTGDGVDYGFFAMTAAQSWAHHSW
ncbi:S-layer homology domain-containing protein [Oscillospiraceae bacterium 50-60]